MLVISGACSPTEDTETISVESRYFDEVVTVLGQGLAAQGPAWLSAVEVAREKVAELHDRQGTYRVLTGLTTEAGHVHSLFRTPTQFENWKAASVANTTSPAVIVESGIGILTLPPIAMDDEAVVEEYVSVGINAVLDAAGSVKCGWVIDLTSNTGGNVYPMLAVLSPFFQEGPVLRFRDRDGGFTTASVRFGAALYEGDVRAQWRGADTRAASTAHLVDMPLAVEQSRVTASAGEAVLVALKGRSDVTTLGEPTRGFPVGTTFKVLSDGAAVTLATHRFSDLQGVVYEGRIAPDMPVRNSNGHPGRRSDAMANVTSRCQA